jgi:hypothetical protein
MATASYRPERQSQISPTRTVVYCLCQRCGGGKTRLSGRNSMHEGIRGKRFGNSWPIVSAVN